jgi:arginine decarboxylase
MAKNYGELYNIEGWGDPYFTVNKEGHLCVRIYGRETIPGQKIDVLSVIDQAMTVDDKRNKLQFPMILRFPDVLKHRLNSLHTAFANAIKYTKYGSVYQGVFPLKVNHNKAVIQDMVNFGYDHSYGLEAGSKPELLIAMSCLTKAKPGAYLVCNGYKDPDYVALALAARALGLNAIIVLEMEEELDIIIKQSSKLGVEPVIGVRAKLLTKIPGHFWFHSWQAWKVWTTTREDLRGGQEAQGSEQAALAQAVALPCRLHDPDHGYCLQVS